MDTCYWCHQALMDGRGTSGHDGPDWCTIGPDGEAFDFGCDGSPDSSPEGCGSHLLTADADRMIVKVFTGGGDPGDVELGAALRESYVLIWHWYGVATRTLNRYMHGGVYPISNDEALRHSRASREYRQAGRMVEALALQPHEWPRDFAPSGWAAAVALRGPD